MTALASAESIAWPDVVLILGVFAVTWTGIAVVTWIEMRSR